MPKYKVVVYEVGGTVPAFHGSTINIPVQEQVRDFRAETLTPEDAVLAYAQQIEEVNAS